MASKKKGRKKSSTKKSSTKSKSTKGRKKKSSKKKSSKKACKSTATAREVAALAATNARLMKSNQELVEKLSKKSSKKKSKKKASKKAGKKATSKRGRKKGEIMTAEGILGAPRAKGVAVWLCAGPRRTGCGGGKKGGHVIGALKLPSRK